MGRAIYKGDLLVHGGGTKAKSTDTTATALTGGIGVGGNPFSVNLPATVGTPDLEALSVSL